MIDILLGTTRSLLMLGIILVLIATWQRTQIFGFLVLAGSFIADLLTGWVIAALFRWYDGVGDGLMHIARGLPLIGLGLAALGCWQIYQALKSGGLTRPAIG